MAENSKIEWTDHTVNLWWGCAKVHRGCKNCYAEHLSDVRYKNNLWGEKAGRRRIKSAFSDLDKYQRQAAKEGVRKKVFIGSMMDIFEDSKPLINPIDDYNTTFDLRNKLFVNIEHNDYPNLIFLFLTKRPENIDKYVPEEIMYRDQLWYGTSISDKKTEGWAMVLYRQTKAKNKFLSIEPQVGPLHNLFWREISTRIDWVIQGGESGPGKRPFDLQWAYDAKEGCEAYGIPYFFKQIDKVQSIPEDLMIREFPKSML